MSSAKGPVFRDGALRVRQEMRNEFARSLKLPR